MSNSITSSEWNEAWPLENSRSGLAGPGEFPGGFSWYTWTQVIGSTSVHSSYPLPASPWCSGSVGTLDHMPPKALDIHSKQRYLLEKIFPARKEVSVSNPHFLFQVISHTFSPIMEHAGCALCAEIYIVSANIAQCFLDCHIIWCWTKPQNLLGEKGQNKG